MIVARLIASGFGIGFVRWAPGTAGSFVAVLIGVLLLLAPPYGLPAAAMLATFGGLLGDPCSARGG